MWFFSIHINQANLQHHRNTHAQFPHQPPCTGQIPRRAQVSQFSIFAPPCKLHLDLRADAGPCDVKPVFPSVADICGAGARAGFAGAFFNASHLWAVRSRLFFDKRAAHPIAPQTVFFKIREGFLSAAGTVLSGDNRSAALAEIRHINLLVVIDPRFTKR
jgi:hypothetical protein